MGRSVPQFSGLGNTNSRPPPSRLRRKRRIAYTDIHTPPGMKLDTTGRSICQGLRHPPGRYNK